MSDGSRADTHPTRRLVDRLCRVCARRDAAFAPHAESDASRVREPRSLRLPLWPGRHMQAGLALSPRPNQHVESCPKLWVSQVQKRLRWFSRGCRPWGQM